MPYYKYSMVFEYLSGTPGGTSANRKAGWSESVYWSDVTPASLNSFRNLAVYRALLLPQYSAIVGLRRQQVDPNGAATTLAVNYPGPSSGADIASDIPQMAVLCSIPATGRSNIRRYRICATCDDYVVRGEFSPGLGMVNYTSFFRQLNGWLMRGKDLTAPFFRLATIANNGDYVLTDPNVFIAGQTVFIKNAISATGAKISGAFQLNTVTNALTGNIRNWTRGPCTLGAMQLYSLVYPAMDTRNLAGFRMVTRKVGRPSTGYRGRRSKRRK